MENLEWVNQELAFYRTNEFKWVRELTKYFETYFDKEFRGSLVYTTFEENDLRLILLFSLRNLYKIVSQEDYYVEVDEQNIGQIFHSLQNPTRDREISINKEKAQRLFISVTLPFRIYEMKISETFRDFFKLLDNHSKLKKINTELENQKIGLKDALKILRGESENKDVEIKIRNNMIVKLRKGIDEEGGIDKLKSLIDKCFKGKVKDFEWESAKATLEKLADECRNKGTYKTLIYSRLGQKIGVHHSTAKRYCEFFGIKRYFK